MLEIVVRGISGNFLQISQDKLGVLESKVPEKAAAVFPQFEVSCLDQILYQRCGRLAPEGRCAHDGKSDWPSDPENNLSHAASSQGPAHRHTTSFRDKDEYRVDMGLVDILRCSEQTPTLSSSSTPDLDSQDGCGGGAKG